LLSKESPNGALADFAPRRSPLEVEGSRPQRHAQSCLAIDVMVDNAAPTIAIGTPSGDHGAVVL